MQHAPSSGYGGGGGLLALSQAVEDDPFDASLRIELGDRLAVSGDERGALAAYKDALRIKPGDNTAQKRARALEERRRERVVVDKVIDDSRRGRWGTGMAVALCVTALAACPPATKAAMSRTRIDLPVTMATVQMAGSALLFLATRCLLGGCGARASDAAPVGLAFGTKLALMNVGLAGSATTTHVLLQSTDVLWSAAFASCIAAETVGSPLGAAALLGCAFGAALVSFNEAKIRNTKESHVALIANLAAPALQGLVIALLRVGVLAAERHSRDERIAAAPRRDVLRVLVEFTAFKLTFAFFAAASLALLVEGRAAIDEVMAWPATLQGADVSAIALSTFLVSIIQFSFTLLASLISAPSVGVVGALKIVPQLALASLIAHMTNSGTFQPLSRSRQFGAALLVLSSMLWAADSSRRLIRGGDVRPPTDFQNGRDHSTSSEESWLVPRATISSRGTSSSTGATFDQTSGEVGQRHRASASSEEELTSPSV